MPHTSLDLRELAPPEPMQRILDALAVLPGDACLEAFTPLYPAPLLAMLDADGYAVAVAPADRGYRVRIVRADHASILDGDADV
ncbi:DUF2249 domain-containing protein [Lysobacter panacisoli]|nr:DUF2249 domain-containing protein [Lysobacter panacisoli]